MAAFLLSLLLLSVPVMADEWVPAGSEQPGFRIMDVAVSGDGRYSALVGDAGIVLLTADGVECWRSPEGSYCSVALSGDGSTLVAGGDGIRIIHKNTTVLATIRSRNFVNDITITTDGSRIAAASDDETLRLYTSAGKSVWSTDTGDDLISVAISPDGTYIVGGTATGNVVLFSDTGDERWTYSLSRQPVISVGIADGARTIAAVSEDGTVSLLSRAGGLLWSGSAPHSGGVSVSDDGATVAVADLQGVRIMERDGNLVDLIPGVDAPVALAMDSDGTRIAVTDGIRVGGFIQQSDVAYEEMGQKGITAEKTENPVAAVSTPIASDGLLPSEKIPVPTQSSTHFEPVVAGLFITTVLTAAGRRYRKKNPDFLE